MEREKIEQDLMKMGYRELVSHSSTRKGTWAKPVAFHLFVFEMDKMMWTNFFKGAKDGSLCVWNSETFKEKDWEVDGKSSFILFLKYTEQYTKIDVRNVDSEFEFLTKEEMYNLSL